MLKKLIPDEYYESVYDIPYEELYKSGKRLIMADMDNTLISYKETLPSEKLKELKKRIEDIGFELIIVSNSRKNRVDNFSNAFGVKYQKFSTKPLKRGIKRAMKKVASRRYNKDEVILIGDQLMTDVYGGKRCKLTVFLIEAIAKGTDIGPTRFNRKLDRFFLKRIKKKYPDLYKEKLSRYGGDLNDNKKM